MKTFRIYTEDKRRGDIVAVVAGSFQAFTMYETKGYWDGIPENSLCIEIVTSNAIEVRKLAATIARVNQQDCCLVQSFDVAAELVDANEKTSEVA